MREPQIAEEIRLAQISRGLRLAVEADGAVLSRTVSEVCVCVRVCVCVCVRVCVLRQYCARRSLLCVL